MITLHRHEIAANIDNRYANIVYLFEFENTNQSGSRELKFELTIDPNAFIAGFEANIDGELFVGQTKEKEKAAKEYKAAKQKNENAILISQPHKDIPNVFQIKTNIDAKSKVVLSITIQQYLQKKFNFNELTVQILRNFSKYGIQPVFKVIDVKLSIKDESGVYDVQIPNGDKIKINQNVTSKDSKQCEIAAEIASESSINELRLRYKVKGEAQESHLLFDANTGTFCHIISDILSNAQIAADEEAKQAPNEGGGDQPCKYLIPRRVVFVLDRSDSMDGVKWQKCVASTVMAVKQLRAGIDKFRVILFDDNVEILPGDSNSRGCVLADKLVIAATIKLLQSKRTNGCTDINKALLRGIELIQFDDDHNKTSKSDHELYMNQIIFITDGEPNSGVYDTKQITLNVQKANQLNGDKNNKIGIFSFGVGREGNDSSWVNDLNHSFLKILSVNNNGFYYRIKQSTADVALSEYFKILSNPILSEIHVEYHDKNITQLTPSKFTALYDGNDLIVCGKINGLKKMKQDNDYNLALTISAKTGLRGTKTKTVKAIDIKKEMSVNVAMNNNKNNNNNEYDVDNSNVERIWAYLKLQEFAKRELVFSDMIELDDDEKSEQDKEPYALAMKCKFVTPWTSMIVVKKKQTDDETANDEITDIQQAEEEEPLNETRFIDMMSSNYSAAAVRSFGSALSTHSPIVYCSDRSALNMQFSRQSVKCSAADFDDDDDEEAADDCDDDDECLLFEADDDGWGDDDGFDGGTMLLSKGGASEPESEKKTDSGNEKNTKQSVAVAAKLEECSVEQLIYLVLNLQCMRTQIDALYAFRDSIEQYFKDNSVDGAKFVMLAKAEKNTKLFNDLKTCMNVTHDKLDQALQQFIDCILHFYAWRQLPMRTLSKEDMETLSKSEDKKECRICNTEFVVHDTTRRLTCSHEFHKDCVDKWCESQNEGGQEASCPLDRTTFRGHCD